MFKIIENLKFTILLITSNSNSFKIQKISNLLETLKLRNSYCFKVFKIPEALKSKDLYLSALKILSPTISRIRKLKFETSKNFIR